MVTNRIAIIDSGSGNVRGIENVVRQLGYSSVRARFPHDLIDVKKIIIPGVGAFDAAMSSLKEFKMYEAIRSHADSGSHILGICLGMQMLVEGSEEGRELGLGLIPGFVRKIESETNLRIPHIGWNDVKITKQNPLVCEKRDLRFYFNHSFAVYEMLTDNIILTVNHGKTFVAGVRSGNIYGVQFHPEKSHDQGRSLIRNFLEYEHHSTTT